MYQGGGAAFQPTLGFGFDNFSVTAWGSTNFSGGNKELDLTLAYKFGKAGPTLTVADLWWDGEGAYNYFNFKRLYIEDILKFLFVVGTVMCVCFGFFMMFSVTETYFGDQSNFTTGLVLLIVGPITMRFIFELQMMGVMLVRNVMDINKKMNKSLSENEDSIRKEDSINPVNSQPKIKE